MTDRDRCIEECSMVLDSAIELIEEMKTILTDRESGSPRVFLEFAHDVHEHIGRAVTFALKPLLERK